MADAQHPETAPPTVAERVAVIRREMLAHRWAPERSAELAGRWKLGEGTVRDYAAEASRQIEAFADLTLELSEAKGWLLEAVDAAREETKPAERARALVACVKAKSEMLGVGKHRDPKNDPKPMAPTEQQGAARVPFGMKQKKDQPS